MLKQETLSENGRDAIVFWSLHGYLVPTQKIVKKDSNGKKSTIKFTIRDSQESFVYFGKSHQEIEDHLMYLKNRKECIQPFIMCVGEDISKITDIYMYFDDVKYSFNSFLRAVDILFKIFYVFNFSFPIESSMFWNFIELYCFEIKSNNSFSKVHVLIENIKTA